MRKRRELDIARLMMGCYEVSRISESRFQVQMPGPADSLYDGGLFKLNLEIPSDYPLKSPSVGFETKVFHPNIDAASGGICLDVINQTWSPMFDLLNIFDSFIPQLLLYPNPSHPLNIFAASLMIKNPELYKKRVKEMVQKSATCAVVQDDISDISREDLSELSDTSDIDMELL